MNKDAFLIGLLGTFVFLNCPSLFSADGVTLRGRLVVPEKWANEVKPNEVEVTLVEQIPPTPPPLPPDWDQRNPEDQDRWWDEFQSSDAGKAFFAEQDRRIDAAQKFDLTFEPDGKFVIYDVPPATYALQGSLEKSIRSKDYLLEVFGQLEVVASAQEVALGDLELVISPILRTGDAVPEFKLVDPQGTAIQLSDYAGRNLLIHFWAAASPPAAQFQQQVQKLAEELKSSHNLEMLSICLDQDPSQVEDFVKANGSVGRMAIVGGWDHAIVHEFGLHGIPSLWLVGPDARFKATDAEFGQALRESGLSLAEILRAKLEGREIPNQPARSATSGDGQ